MLLREGGESIQANKENRFKRRLKVVLALKLSNVASVGDAYISQIFCTVEERAKSSQRDSVRLSISWAHFQSTPKM